MNRRTGGLIAALVLALLGTLALVRYVEGAKEKAISGGQLVPVLVLTEGVPRGAPAARIATSVKTVRVPVTVRPPDALTSLDRFKNRVAAVDLVAGETLLSSRLTTPEAIQQVEVPKDKLRVTLSLEPERAAGGSIRVGDTVAVLASFDPFGPRGEDGNVLPNTTHLILHKVPVTGVQLEKAAPKADEAESDDPRALTAAPAGNLLVTLALDAPAVERVVFAAEHGRVWLSAEPLEANEAGTKIVTPLNEYQ